MSALNAPFEICARGFLSLLAVTASVILLTGDRTVAGAEAGHRALVLGGGGPVGEAWESGVILGLKDKGIDLSQADRIIGTSAGAIVGARLASRVASKDFIDAALARADAPPPGQPAQAPSGPPPDLSFLATKLVEMGVPNASQQTISAEIGKWALGVHPVVSEAEFVASYQRRFPDRGWPSPAYQCAAVDANDGSLRVWNESSGVPLALAVASSCALPGVFAPVSIEGHRYMDGGVRSVTNADLVRGCKTAVILAPTKGLADPMAKSFTRPLDAELQILRESGCKVALIAPDAASLRAFGASIGDESHRAPPLEAGRIQGRSAAAEIARLWND